MCRVSDIPQRTVKARGVSVVTESDYGVGVVYPGLKVSEVNGVDVENILPDNSSPRGEGESVTLFLAGSWVILSADVGMRVHGERREFGIRCTTLFRRRQGHALDGD